MNLIVKPAEGLSGELKLQPSKLYTQFATAIALLAKGKSTIEFPLRVKDTLALLHAVEGMGAMVKRTQERWTIWGVGASLRPEGNVVDAKNSATALSLMTSIATLVPRITVLTGDVQLRTRRMPSFLEALRRLGANAYSVKPDESPPFIVFGDKLKGGRISLGKATSMKYLLALLLPCPYAKKPIELKFARKLESPSLEFVDGLLDAAGIELKVRERRMSISNKPYQAFDTEVPPDFAAAAPFITAAALTGSELKLRNLGRARGRDDFFLQVLDRMGVKLQKSKKGLIISSPQKLRAARLDLSKAPELLPFIAVLACGAKGKTTIRGAGDARDMKSDRISAMARELRRMKAKVLERRDGLLIKGPARLKGGEVDGHNDYAIVAALAVAGLIAEGETKIKNRAEALQTSYPRFISTFQELGADVRYAM